MNTLHKSTSTRSHRQDNTLMLSESRNMIYSRQRDIIGHKPAEHQRHKHRTSKTWLWPCQLRLDGSCYMYIMYAIFFSVWISSIVLCTYTYLYSHVLVNDWTRLSILKFIIYTIDNVSRNIEVCPAGVLGQNLLSRYDALNSWTHSMTPCFTILLCMDEC